MDRNIIISSCFDFIDKKINDIQIAINDADAGIKEETKSSAGDKYETSREMIQQDLNRYQQQMKLAVEDKNVLTKILDSKKDDFSKIGLGSIIETQSGIYFLSISIGVLKIGDKSIFVISPQSPIGKELIGKSVGDSFRFLQKDNSILKIM